MDNGIINHVAIVADGSGSTDHIQDALKNMVVSEIQGLATLSSDLGQDTRITLYRFSGRVECLIYDRDVLRLPQFDTLFMGQSTALLQATKQAIDELKETAQRYGDHLFLLYVFTDGEENASRGVTSAQMKQMLNGLPDNWTVVIFVPDDLGVSYAKRFGYPEDNIVKWDAKTAQGVRQMGRTINTTTEAILRNRVTTGIKGYKNIRNLVNVDTSTLNKTDVQNTLMKLYPNDYFLVSVNAFDPRRIDDFCRTKLGTFGLGHAFYELTKKETVQPGKQVALMDKATGEVFTGSEARKLVGLDSGYNEVTPGYNPKFQVFIQSTAPNRNLVPNTQLLYLK